MKTKTEYKVLNLGSSESQIEGQLNTLTQEGWRLMSAAYSPAHGNVFVLFLERTTNQNQPTTSTKTTK